MAQHHKLTETHAALDRYVRAFGAGAMPEDTCAPPIASSARSAPEWICSPAIVTPPRRGSGTLSMLKISSNVKRAAPRLLSREAGVTRLKPMIESERPVATGRNEWWRASATCDRDARNGQILIRR